MNQIPISYELHMKLKQAVEEGMKIPACGFGCSAEIYYALDKWKHRNDKDDKDEQGDA